MTFLQQELTISMHASNFDHALTKKKFILHFVKLFILIKGNII